MSPRKLDALLLALALGAALFFRVWQLDQVPPGMDFDEAFESLEAHRVVTEHGYHPVFFSGNNGVPPTEIYLTAAVYLIAGEHMLAIRSVSAAVGILTVLALYGLVRTLFPWPRDPDSTDNADSPSPAVRRFLPFMVALLLAVLPWHVAFSRRGIEVALLPLWAVLAVLFFWQGLATRQWWRFALSGFFVGSAFYTYQAAPFMPGVLALFVIYKAFQERGFLRRWAWQPSSPSGAQGQLLILVVVAGLTLVPLVAFALHNPEVFAHRGLQVTLFTLGRGSEAPWRNLAGNALKVAGLFVIGGDVNRADNITARPPIPLLLALALLLGLLMALRQARRPGYALLLIWFGWMLVPTLITEDAPSIRRAIGATPPMVTLIALGLGWAYDGVGRWAQARSRWQAFAPAATGAALAALLLYMVGWGYQYYFISWGRDKDLFYWFDQGLVELGEYAASTPPDTRLYYTPAGEGEVVHLPLVWQVRGRMLRAFDGEFGLVLAPEGPERSLYLIRTFLGDSRSLPALKGIYPTGRVVHQVNDLRGNPHSLVFAVEPGTKPLLQPQNRLSANFGGEVELLGSDLSNTVLRPGDALTVTLYLKSLSGPTSSSYTVFTHLVGPPNPASGSPVWAGHDRPPLHNSYPTTRWGQGEIILDQHAFSIPDDAPSGAYQVEAGLYDPQAGDVRLKVLGGSEKQADSVVLGSVLVQ